MVDALIQRGAEVTVLCNPDCGSVVKDLSPLAHDEGNDY